MVFFYRRFRPLDVCIYAFGTKNDDSSSNLPIPFINYWGCHKFCVYDSPTKIIMKKDYIFREIKKDELDEALSIIRERIAWMDEVGIKQWNVTDYEEVYPLSYYEECRQNGVLVIKAKQKIRLLPALNIDDDSLIKAIKILKEACAK